MTDKIAGSKATFEKMGVPGLLKLTWINVIVHPSSVFERSVYSWNFLFFTVEELPAIVGELKNKFKDDFGIDFDNGKCSFETERNERNV